jgi:hypothetical protein
LWQRALGEIVAVSHTTISRIERGLEPDVPYRAVALVGAALGLDVPLRAYPSGEPVRDAAQLALLAQMRALLVPSLGWRTEVPLGGPGDLRAWDAVITGPGWTLPVEAETRIRDVQALTRRLALKQRDSGAERMLLVVADTRHNRHVLRLAAPDLEPSFPVPDSAALQELARGNRPAASAIIRLGSSPRGWP